MSKIILDVKTEDLANLRDGDILMFSETEKCFYRQTSKEFWKMHNDELSKIIKRYDELFEKLSNGFKELEKKEIKFEEEVEKHEIDHEKKTTKILEEYLSTNKNITSKLIEMVENFIKSGGSL